MNKIVLITGASSGMGKETAILLSQNGFVVYAAARRIERMHDLEEMGIKVLSMDVTDEESVRNGVDLILRNEGRIDILINNAGFGFYGTIEEVDIQSARQQMEVNVFGLARLTQLVLPCMRKQNAGKIINISSIGGKMVLPFGGWYHASKFAVEALSDALRLELSPWNIDVIVIEPGGVKSEWSEIAMKNLKETSCNGPYRYLAEKMYAMGSRFNDKNAEPGVIARLILKAIRTQRPKTRYHAGYMSGTILFLRKWLPDRMFDWGMMGQLKG